MEGERCRHKRQANKAAKKAAKKAKKEKARQAPSGEDTSSDSDAEETAGKRPRHDSPDEADPAPPSRRHATFLLWLPDAPPRPGSAVI